MFAVVCECIKCKDVWYMNMEFMNWDSIQKENFKLHGKAYYICEKCSEDGKEYSVNKECK